MKPNLPKYIHKFLGHLDFFINEYDLFKRDSKLLVAVSGGVDSIVLLKALTCLSSFGYSNHLRVIHINHASRQGQDAEEDFVKSFCAYNEIEFQSMKLKGLAEASNFEYRARLGRYEAFNDIKHKDELIVLAHHIDDSFEWSLLQMLRSSTVEGTVGIPVKNDDVIRPFMCVTKSQIERFATLLDLPFISDPTNTQIKFERNFLRHEVISAFKDRHPKYLKHYVYRHNELARRLGVHLKLKDRSLFRLSMSGNSALIYTFSQSRDSSGLNKIILEALKNLNPNSRGKVNSQIEKIVKAMVNGKSGPISLTNSIQAYIDHHLILLTKETKTQLNEVFETYKTFSLSEFEEYLTPFVTDQKAHLSFPFIVLIKGQKLDKRNFKLIFNKQEIERFTSNENQHYPALKLLREWSKKRNRHRVLRLNFLTSV